MLMTSFSDDKSDSWSIFELDSLLDDIDDDTDDEAWLYDDEVQHLPEHYLAEAETLDSIRVLAPFLEVWVLKDPFIRILQQVAFRLLNANLVVARVGVIQVLSEFPVFFVFAHILLLRGLVLDGQIDVLKGQGRLVHAVVVQ
ncbi:hypothetical protein VF21_06623 [Pseudogymnoascus sp. 05NY08]|nr:hypothetical protein VF21_06623 [Pseudogymnoascus sp. 05NY08]